MTFKIRYVGYFIWLHPELNGGFTSGMWTAEKSQKFMVEFKQHTDNTSKEENCIPRHGLMLGTNFVCDGSTFLLHLQNKDKSSRFAVGSLFFRRLFFEDMWGDLKKSLLAANYSLFLPSVHCVTLTAYVALTCQKINCCPTVLFVFQNKSPKTYFSWQAPSVWLVVYFKLLRWVHAQSMFN